ncbi:MAG TPA: glycosyltransferase family 39 protein [Candidatus Eremiobacteraceae bacterium]|nr:glycosyltransferase family 39 protein [Candidatus Eremiobacteraceae bacterium]
MQDVRDARVPRSFARFWTEVPFWVILIAAALLRCIEAIRRPLQVDEALTLDMAGLPLKQGVALMGADVHPPLILIMLHPFEALHVPDVVVRVIMVALGIASVAIIYAIVNLWAGRVPALIAMMLAAAMPTIVFYDTWVRMYAPFSTIELLSWYFLSVVFVKHDLSVVKRRTVWAGWVLCTIASLYLLYLALFVLASQLIWIAVRERAALVKPLIGAVVALAAFLPQLPVFIHQMSFGGQSWPWGLEHPGAAIFRIPGEALLHPETDAWLDPIHVIAVVGLAAALAAVFFFSRDTALPWLGLSSLLVVLVSLAKHESLYLDRYFLLLGYAACAWCGVALAKVAAMPRPGGLAVAGIVALVAAYGIVRATNPYFYTADWPAIWSYVALRADSRDAVVAEQPSSLLALKRILPRTPFAQIGVDAGGQVAAAKTETIKTHRRIWLVLFEATAVDPNSDLLKDLSPYYRVDRVTRFDRATTGESVTVAELNRK